MIKIDNPKNLITETKKENIINVLTINSLNEITLINIDDIYYFVGGHLKEDESLSTNLKYEIKEDTGISLEERNAFYSHIVRTSESNIQYTHYFAIYTDKDFGISSQSLDPRENKRTFSSIKIPIENASDFLVANMKTEKEQMIYSEMIEAIYFYQNHLNHQNFQKNESERKRKMYDN